MAFHTGKSCNKCRSESLPKQMPCSVSSGLLLAMPGDTISSQAAHCIGTPTQRNPCRWHSDSPRAGTWLLSSYSDPKWQVCPSTWQWPACHGLSAVVSRDKKALVCIIMVSNWAVFPALLACRKCSGRTILGSEHETRNRWIGCL